MKEGVVIPKTRKEAALMASSIINSFISKHKAEIEKYYPFDLEDFRQDILLNILSRQGLNHYDPSKVSSFRSLILLICHRYLTDCKRKFFSRYKLSDEQTEDGLYPLAIPISELTNQDDESDSVFDTFGYTDESFEYALLLSDILNLLPENDIMLQTKQAKITWRQFLLDLLNGQSLSEIAESYKVSRPTIRKYFKELKDYLALRGIFEEVTSESC